MYNGVGFGEELLTLSEPFMKLHVAQHGMLLLGL
jgi:hypothetical protein